MSDVTGAGVSSGAAGSSPAPSPASPSSTPVSAAPASASETPAGAPESGAAPSPTVAPPEPGPVPYGRFKEINDQLRAAKEFQSKYERVAWADQFQQQPDVFVEEWIDQLAAHPQYQSKIFAKAARLLNSRRGQTPQVAEEPKPDIPITNESGQMVGQTYSADQLKKWREWDWAQKQASFDERIAPLEQQAKTQQQREQLAELQQQSWDGASKTLTELRQNPYFKEHEPKVRAALAAHEEWADNIHAAFNHVLLTEILPTLSQQEQRKVVESLQQKAGASTVGPSGAAAATPKKFKNHAEAMAYYEAHPAEAEAMANR